LVAIISSVVHAAQPDVRVSSDGMSWTPMQKSVGRRRRGSGLARSSASCEERLDRIERM
jgi:hypothetical protein